MANAHNSISVLILPSSQNQFAFAKSAYKTNVWNKGVISYYHMNLYLFNQPYPKFHEKMLILGVDFDQYFRSEYSMQNQYSHRNIGQNLPPKLIIFHEILQTTV